MIKPITSEMIQAMSLDQLKTLRKNAEASDKPASKEILDLIAQSGLLKTKEPKPAKPATKRAVKRKPPAEKVADAGPKTVRASHSRQA